VVARRRLLDLRFLVAVALLAAIAVGIDWLITRPPLIDIGAGLRLAVRTEGHGRPPVVLQSGLANPLSRYDRLQERIARVTEVLAYERAGIGRSGAGPLPRTADQLASELHALLGRLAIERAVLVCHADGCLAARVFAHRFPQQVAALVFIDPLTEAFYDHMRANPAEWAHATRSLAGGSRQEWDALAQSAQEASQAWPLPQVPYVVVTAQRPFGRWPLATRADQQAWVQSHEALLGRLGGVTTHLLLPQATDGTVLQETSVAAAVIEAVERARTRSMR